MKWCTFVWAKLNYEIVEVGDGSKTKQWLSMLHCVIFTLCWPWGFCCFCGMSFYRHIRLKKMVNQAHSFAYKDRKTVFSAEMTLFGTGTTLYNERYICVHMSHICATVVLKGFFCCWEIWSLADVGCGPGKCGDQTSQFLYISIPVA